MCKMRMHVRSGAGWALAECHIKLGFGARLGQDRRREPIFSCGGKRTPSHIACAWSTHTHT